MCLCKHRSINLPLQFNKDIGRKLLGSERLSFLCTGVTSARFQSEGNFFIVKDKLNNFLKCVIN